ncbi:MAG: hypothetical protein QW753_05795 [Thermofilum sp.]
MRMYPDLVSLLLGLLSEIAALLPKVLLGVGAFFLAFFVVRLLHRAVKVLVAAGGIEDKLREIIPGGMKIPLASLISFILGAMILVSVASLVIRLFIPEYTAAYRSFVDLLARLGSVAALTLISVVVVDTFAKSMGLERKTERFFTMLLSLLIVMLAIDLAALSPEVKQALTFGLAIGVGLLIGAFALWAFFGDYIEKVLARHTG